MTAFFMRREKSTADNRYRRILRPFAHVSFRYQACGIEILPLFDRFCGRLLKSAKSELPGPFLPWFMNGILPEPAPLFLRRESPEAHARY